MTCPLSGICEVTRAIPTDERLIELFLGRRPGVAEKTLGLKDIQGGFFRSVTLLGDLLKVVK